MKHQHLLIVAVLAALSFTAGACAVGPQAWGIPASGSSSAKLGPVEVNHNPPCVGMPSAGRLKIEVDSTAGADPDHITYRTMGDTGWHSPVALAGPVNHHFEATTSQSYNAGNCPGLIITVWACINPCPAWEASSQTFNYRVSIVP